VVIHQNGAEFESVPTPDEGELLRAMLFMQPQHYQHYMHQSQQHWQHKLNHLWWQYSRSEICILMQRE
jgi:hypothetical protein